MKKIKYSIAFESLIPTDIKKGINVTVTGAKELYAIVVNGQRFILSDKYIKKSGMEVKVK